MAQQRHTLDMTKSLLVTDADSYQPETSTPDKDNQRIGLYPTIPYEAKNVLPTSAGYKSFFGVDAIQDASGLPAGLVPHEHFVYQTSQYVNMHVLLTDRGIYMREQGSAWEHIVVMPTPPVGTDYMWTMCVLKNVIFLYRQDQDKAFGIEEYSGGVGLQFGITGIPLADRTDEGKLASGIAGVVSFVPTTINMTGQLGIFRAGGSLGFWDSEDAVSWSSPVNLKDFTPAITTLANTTTLTDVVGRITVIKGFGDGFMVYATKSVVKVMEDPSALQRFKAEPVYSNVGVVYPKEVVVAQPDNVHFAWTTAGLVQFEIEQHPTVIVPEVTDWLRQARSPMYLSYLNNRYLCLQLLDASFITGNVEFSTQSIDPDDLKYLGAASGGGVIPGVHLPGNEVCFHTQPDAAPTGETWPYLVFPEFSGYMHTGISFNDVGKRDLTQFGVSPTIAALWGQIIYMPTAIDDTGDWEGVVVEWPTRIEATTTQLEVKDLALNDFKETQQLEYDRAYPNLELQADYQAELATHFASGRYKGLLSLAQVPYTTALGNAPASTYPVADNADLVAFRASYDNRQSEGYTVDLVRDVVPLTLISTNTVNDIIYKTGNDAVYSQVQDEAFRLKAPLDKVNLEVFLYEAQINTGVERYTIQMDQQPTVSISVASSASGYPGQQDSLSNVSAHTAFNLPAAGADLTGQNPPLADMNDVEAYMLSVIGTYQAQQVADLVALGANPANVTTTASLTWGVRDNQPAPWQNEPSVVTWVSTTGNFGVVYFFSGCNTTDVHTVFTANVYRLDLVEQGATTAYDPYGGIEDKRGLIGTTAWRYTDEHEDPIRFPVLWVQMIDEGTDFIGQTQLDSGVDAAATFSNRKLGYTLGAGIAANVGQTSQQVVCGVVSPIDIPDLEVPPLNWAPWTVEIPTLTWLLQNGSPAPLDPTFQGAYVYDTQLQKWGNMVQEFKLLTDYQPLGGLDTQGITDYKNFMADAGAILPNLTTAVFSDKPAEAYIRYGKYRHWPAAKTGLQEVNVRFNNPSTGLLVAQTSIDGRSLAYGISEAVDFTDALKAHLGCSIVGEWHTITLAGQFDITHIEVVSHPDGRR